MLHDLWIDPAIQTRIQVELDRIEVEHKLKILLAVESGSRAWRFASRDSDYDVRFIYVRPLADYLSILPTRDVIERPVDAIFDVSGWDVRKALQLMLRSNAALLEWLNSPIRYRGDNATSERLRELAYNTVDLGRLGLHYRGLTQNSWEKIEASGEDVRLKTYFYSLRTALALRWISERKQPPPMDLPSVMAGLILDDNLIQVVSELVSLKREATEQDTIPRNQFLDRIIADALTRETPEAKPATSSPDSAAAVDEFFAHLLSPSAFNG